MFFLANLDKVKTALSVVYQPLSVSQSSLFWKVL